MGLHWTRTFVPNHLFTMLNITWIQKRLQQAHHLTFSLYAALVAFGTYSCMYAFRKPFTAGIFEGVTFLGIDYKIWLVITQTIGYACSKFYGIRFIAEMKGNKRAQSIMVLIGIAWIALFCFAVVPAPYNIVFLFLNGFPLGMIWGLVFSYLEGRRSTEFMGAVLSVSFIFSSGFVKSVGKMTVVNWHVTEYWMPFITGLIFIVPIMICILLLEQIPSPTAADEQLRTRRAPMNKPERKAFLQAFLPGLVLLIASYVLLTVLRDMRDNFAADIWKDLGYGAQAGIFTQTEIPVSVAIIVIMGLLVFVKNNFHAFMLNHFIVITGFLVALISTLLYKQHRLDPVWWMTLTGLGLYMGYIPFNCIFFERLIAVFKYVSNVGFIIYVADSFGYLGSVLVMLFKNFSGMALSWSQFFMDAVLGVSVTGIVMMIASAWYFKKRYESVNNKGTSNLGGEVQIAA
ncbi:MFS family permease [Chitinophaga sp. W2I13]